MADSSTLNVPEIPQDQGFITFYNNLPEKPATTFRFFDRGDFYTLHGQDALFTAKEYFKTHSIIKMLGSGTKRLESVALNRNHFESFSRELLIVRHCCVDIYSPRGSGKGDWVVSHQASPGNLLQVEELIFGSQDMTSSAGILAFSKQNGAEGSGNQIIGCCYLDSNDKRQFLVAQFADSDSHSNLESMVVQLSPKEILIPSGDGYESIRVMLNRYGALLKDCKKADFNSTEAIGTLNKLLRFKKGQQANSAALPEADLQCSMGSLSALVKYLKLMEDGSNMGQYTLKTFDFSQYVRLDAAAAAALHLTSYGAESMMIASSGMANKGAPRTISALLNKCRTSGGQRLLSQWIKQPLTDKGRIERRLDLVEIFFGSVHLRQSVTEDHLRRMPDYQRLGKKLLKGKGTLLDLYKIYLGLSRVPVLIECLAEYDGPHGEVLLTELIQPLKTSNERTDKLKQMIETTLDIKQAEQGDYVIRADFDEQLTELKEKLDDCDAKAKKSQSKAASDLGLDSVKLESDGRIGYFFRVTLKDEKSLRNRQKEYRTVDTNKSGVRFRNDRLEEINETYLATRREYEAQQESVVKEILGVAAGYVEPLQYLSDTLSRLDVLTSFAVCASSAPIPYVRPVILDRGSGPIELIQVRHPCMELQEGVLFIANDAVFHNDGHRFYIITGPNMGGKSTYLRSVGVAVLMTQLGCFVAAESATVSIVDAILARVGSGDCHLKGVSTFMAEMIETAHIIKTATRDSLVIIDELGRGTSTFDGFGLAWAIAEHVSTKIQPCALFATHFHELTALSEQVPSVSNLHVSALTGEDTFTLLYKVQPGSCDQSFGLHVAKLVQFPLQVLEKAKAKANELEAILPIKSSDGEPESKRLRIADEEGHKLLRSYLERAKALIEKNGGDGGEDMKKLKEEVLQNDNPFLKCVLNA